MEFLRDLRHAARTLRATPGYAATCVLVLALGIGANAAIFSVLYSVVIDALPYPHLSRLVYLWERFPGLPAPVGERSRVAHRNFEEWRRRAGSFDAMEAYRGMRLDETGGAHPAHVDVGFATPGLFSLLGTNLRLGRVFTAAEGVPGADRVALLSDAYFDRRFHRDPAALGRTLAVAGTDYVVIGVLPPDFHVPSTYQGDDQVKGDVWVPLSRLWSGLQEDHARELNVVARLKPGVSLSQARAELARIERDLQTLDGTFDKGWHTSIFPFTVEDSNPKVHLAIYVLAGAVAFLLLIGCANLANLTLARASLRGREIAVRYALGGTAARIVRQLAAEALLVSFGGAALGLLLAHWIVNLIRGLRAEDIQRPELISINLPVFLFAAAVALFTTLLLFGVLPAIAASRQDLTLALRAGGWGASAARLRSRQFLITAEVALALVLLTGAGLLIRSFREVMAVGIGFRTESLTATDISLPAKTWPDATARSRFFRALLERVRAIPGVSGAALTDTLPLHSITMHNFSIEGRPEPDIEHLPISDESRITPGYLELLGVRLETGRALTERDLQSGHSAIAVNREFVRKFFPNQNPLGHVLLDQDGKRHSEIVAVVSDYKAMGVENGNRPAFFSLSADLPSVTLVVRGGEGAGLAAAVRQAVWSLDPNLPAPETRALQYYVDGWLSQRRFVTLLLEVFAGLALVLAMVGVYGVLANLVSSRTREIGIRMALGAAPSVVARMVVRQSALPILTGVAVGLAGSLAVGRLLESLLFQVHAGDPLALAGASLAILAVTPAALFVPLRRAVRVNCSVALRQE